MDFTMNIDKLDLANLVGKVMYKIMEYQIFLPKFTDKTSLNGPYLYWPIMSMSKDKIMEFQIFYVQKILTKRFWLWEKNGLCHGHELNLVNLVGKVMYMIMEYQIFLPKFTEKTSFNGPRKT